MDYSDEVLEATPERVTKFLTGMGAVAAIRTLMAQAGMTDDDIVEGRTLLLDVLAAPPKAGAAPDTDDARAQRAAKAELDQWDEPNFLRYGATLLRRFPDAYEYVFRDLAPSTGTAAVQGVATFLARAVIKKRGYLIRLGLASRKAPHRKPAAAPARPEKVVGEADELINK